MKDSSQTPAIEIEQLYKEYIPGIAAVDKISLKINQGSFFGLLGPNGAGKSTTIGILSSLVQKTAGQVRIFNTDLHENPQQAKSYLGVVPQEYNLNIFEPCRQILIQCAGYYGIKPHVAKERADYLLQEMGLWNERDRAVRTLSGGMKRRLMIARALVHDPKVLILDEPTAGVDVTLRRFLWDFLQKQNESGLTILLTTHYLEEAEALCKQLAIINQGQIIAQGTTQELLTKLSYETFVIECRGLVKEQNIPQLHYSVTSQGELEVQLSPHQSLTSLIHLLNKQGIEVMRIKNRTSRLEELFMQLINLDEERK